MTKHNAIYMRVSTKAQDTKSQKAELQAWASANGDLPCVWYTDTGTGKTMDRPGWRKLEAAMRVGQVATLVVWRIDRLGRTAKGLTTLFEDLQQRKVNLKSLKDGLDLSTINGRLMATLLAGLAVWETELRGERVLAGQAVARAAGKRWGGSKAGTRKVVTPEQAKAIHQLHRDKTPITRIAKAVKLSRPTIYSVLADKV